MRRRGARALARSRLEAADTRSRCFQVGRRAARFLDDPLTPILRANVPLIDFRAAWLRRS